MTRLRNKEICIDIKDNIHAGMRTLLLDADVQHTSADVMQIVSNSLFRKKTQKITKCTTKKFELYPYWIFANTLRNNFSIEYSTNFDLTVIF